MAELTDDERLEIEHANRLLNRRGSVKGLLRQESVMFLPRIADEYESAPTNRSSQSSIDVGTPRASTSARRPHSAQQSPTSASTPTRIPALSPSLSSRLLVAEGGEPDIDSLITPRRRRGDSNAPDPNELNRRFERYNSISAFDKTQITGKSSSKPADSRSAEEKKHLPFAFDSKAELFENESAEGRARSLRSIVMSSEKKELLLTDSKGEAVTVLNYDSLKFPTIEVVDRFHSGRVYAMLDIGHEVWSCSLDGSIRVWKAFDSNDRNALIKTVEPRAKDTFCRHFASVCVFGNKQYIAAAFPSLSCVRLYDPQDHTKLRDISTPSPPAFILQTSDRNIWVGCSGEIVVYEPQNFTQIHVIEVEGRQVDCMCEFRQRVWTSAHGSSLDVTLLNFEKVTTFKKHTSRVTVLRCVGSELWSGAFDGSILAWAAPEGKLKARKIASPHRANVNEIVSNNEFAFTVGDDGVIGVFCEPHTLQRRQVARVKLAEQKGKKATPKGKKEAGRPGKRIPALSITTTAPAAKSQAKAADAIPGAPKFKLEVLLQNTEMFAGEVAIGHVVLELKKPIRLIGAGILLQGLETCFAGLMGEKPTYEQKAFWKFKIPLWGIQDGDPTGYRVLQPDTYTWAFKYKIPVGLPSTVYVHEFASVSYAIQAALQPPLPLAGEAFEISANTGFAKPLIGETTVITLYGTHPFRWQQLVENTSAYVSRDTKNKVKVATSRTIFSIGQQILLKVAVPDSWATHSTRVNVRLFHTLRTQLPNYKRKVLEEKVLSITWKLPGITADTELFALPLPNRFDPDYTPSIEKKDGTVVEYESLLVSARGLLMNFSHQLKITVKCKGKTSNHKIDVKLVDVMVTDEEINANKEKAMGPIEIE